MERGRAYRRHQRRRVIKTRADKYFRLGIMDRDGEFDSPGFYGRMAKHSPMDCGNPKCMLCHAYKNYQREKLTHSDLKKLQNKEIDEHG